MCTSIKIKQNTKNTTLSGQFQIPMQTYADGNQIHAVDRH